MAWRRKIRIAKATAQKIEDPTTAELDWIAGGVVVATELVVTYAGIQPESPPEPPALDAAYAAWLEDWEQQAEDERDDPNIMVNAFGLAFGQYLVDTLGMQWVVVTDEQGSEIAVHGQPGDMLVFPPNMVAKRLERREVHFFVPLYEEAKALRTRLTRHRRDG